MIKSWSAMNDYLETALNVHVTGTRFENGNCIVEVAGSEADLRYSIEKTSSELKAIFRSKVDAVKVFGRLPDILELVCYRKPQYLSDLYPG